MLTWVLEVAAATCLYVQASRVTQALQRSDLRLALSLPYKHLKWFHHRVAISQTHLCNTFCLPPVPKDCSFGLQLNGCSSLRVWSFHERPSHQLHVAHQQSKIWREGLTLAILKQSKHKHHHPPSKKIINFKNLSIHSLYNHLTHCLCTLNTKLQVLP